MSHAFELFVKCLRNNIAQRGLGQLHVSCSQLIWAFTENLSGGSAWRPEQGSSWGLSKVGLVGRLKAWAYSPGWPSAANPSVNHGAEWPYRVVFVSWDIVAQGGMSAFGVWPFLLTFLAWSSLLEDHLWSPVLGPPAPPPDAATPCNRVSVLYFSLFPSGICKSLEGRSPGLAQWLAPNRVV